ncbi:MAG: invasin domain 3-containing protein [Armatimonadota bacterium]
MRAVIPVVVLLGLGISSASGASGYAIWLSSYPRAIVADSHSYSTITAEVRDPTGRIVPDGTLVEFTTSLGVIERRARTVSGVARARLESGNTPGTAIVTAVLMDGGAVAQARVDILELGTDLTEETFISVYSSEFLGYDVDRRIVDVTGEVTIYHRGITIRAKTAQIDLNTNIIRARGRTGIMPVTVERGNKSLRAEVLWYDFDSMHGAFISSPEEGAKRFVFRGKDLFSEPDTSTVENANKNEDRKFEFASIGKSKLFIRCKSMIIRPGVEIKFKRASYYIDGDKLVTVPLHVLSLRGEGSGVDQMLAYGTEGVRLNLPIYYLLTPTFTGAVRIKRSESAGWGYYAEREGWQIDIDQDYNTKGTTEGRLSLNRITSGEWGIRWNQRAELTPDTQLYTYLDFPARRDLYTTVDFTRKLRNYTWASSFRSNKLRSFPGRYQAQTYLQSSTRSLVQDVISYSFTTRLSYDSGLQSNSNKFGCGLGILLYGRPITFGRRTSVTTSVTLGRDWGGYAEGSTVFVNTTMFHALTTRGIFNLNYSYSRSDTTAGYGYSAQRLSSSLYLNLGPNWGTNVYVIYGLDDHTTSMFGQIGYTFAKDWRFDLLTTVQKLQYGKFSDIEIALSKIIGRQQAILAWSQSRRRIRFELTAASL